MATPKTTLDSTLAAMQKINKEVTAINAAISKADALVRDPNSDTIKKYENRKEMEELLYQKAKLEIPQLKARRAYDRAKAEYKFHRWRTHHQPRIAEAAKAFNVELEAAVDANTKLSYALVEASNEGCSIPIGAQWPELFRQKDLRNRDSKLEHWQREMTALGYLT